VAQDGHHGRDAAATGNQDDPSVSDFIEVELTEWPGRFHHQAHGRTVAEEPRHMAVG